MKKLFYCLGVTKGGTTWLHWALSHHPQVAAIPRKEIHYFLRQYGGTDRLTDAGRMHQLALLTRRAQLTSPATRELTRIEGIDPEVVGAPWDEAMQKAWSANGASTTKYERLLDDLQWYTEYVRGPIDDHWYRNLFAHIGEDQWPIDFSTTNYTVRDAGYASMAGMAEDARAVIILRDPIERLWSHLKFHAEITGDFDNLSQWSNDEIRAFAHKFKLPQSSFYARSVESLYRHFSEDRSLVLSFSDLRDKPEQLFVNVQEFLGLDPIPLPEAPKTKEDGRLNTSKSLKMPRGVFAPLADDFLRDLEALEKLGVNFVRPWMTKAVAYRSEKEEPKPTAKRGWRDRFLNRSA